MVEPAEVLDESGVPYTTIRRSPLTIRERMMPMLGKVLLLLIGEHREHYERQFFLVLGGALAKPGAFERIGHMVLRSSYDRDFFSVNLPIREVTII